MPNSPHDPPENQKLPYRHSQPSTRSLVPVSQEEILKLLRNGSFTIIGIPDTTLTPRTRWERFQSDWSRTHNTVVNHSYLNDNILYLTPADFAAVMALKR